MTGPAPLLLLLAAPTIAFTVPSCGWHKPPRIYPDGVRWACVAARWVDGDTSEARCDGQPGTVAVRLRGVDAHERGVGRWREAREELRRRTIGQALIVAPHHCSHRRAVADVLAGGANVGEAMDAAGWSRADCQKR